MISNGEHELSFYDQCRPEEFWRDQLVEQCISEALNFAEATTQSGADDVDRELFVLAAATDSLAIANRIKRDNYRLACLAGIADRTNNADVQHAVVTEAVDIFGNQSGTGILVSIAKQMRDSGDLLQAITDAELRDELASGVAGALESPELIDAIQDPEKRQATVITIVRRTNHDIGPFLDKLDADGRQQAIWARAAEQEDTALASLITDTLARVQLLLTIARRQPAKLDPNTAALIAQLSDNDPIVKADCLKEYIEISGDERPVHDLHSIALTIEDPVERARYLAVVFAITKDPTIEPELSGLLKAQGDNLPPQVRNELRGGLAIGLCDHNYALSMFGQPREATLLRVVIEKGDVGLARDIARTIQSPSLLRAFAIAHDNMDLAVEMADSDDRHTQEFGMQAVVEIMIKAGDMRLLSQLKNGSHYSERVISRLVTEGSLALVGTVIDPQIRAETLERIARSSRNIELARRLGLAGVVSHLEASSSIEQQKRLPIEQVGQIPEIDFRINIYFSYPDRLKDFKDEVLESIRQLPQTNQATRLLDLAEIVVDPAIAYEALGLMQGSINTTYAIELVARMIAVTKGRPINLAMLPNTYPSY